MAPEATTTTRLNGYERELQQGTEMINPTRRFLLVAAVAAAMLSLGGNASADSTEATDETRQARRELRAEHRAERLDERGDAIEGRLDRRGERVNQRMDRRSARAEEAGQRTERLDRISDRRRRLPLSP